jgi:ABC-2 type transport system permease protein
LQEVLVAFGGQIREKSGSKFEFTPLLRTGRGTSGAVDFEKIFRQSGFPFGGGREFDERVIDVQRPDSREHIVAAAIRSTDADEPLNVIFIADIDLVSNQMYQFWESQTAGLSLDNILFVYNCVDSLAGNTDYIALRNRRAAQRTLKTIDAQKRQFVESAQKQALDAQTRADEALEAARKRMQEELDKMRNDKSLDAGQLEARLRMLEETENRRLALEEKEINRERDEQIRKTKAESEQQIRAIESQVMLRAWMFPAIPAVILGLIMLGRRMLDERRGISSERLVRR